MSSDVAVMENEVKEFKLQLENVQTSLQVDPDNTELQSLKTELEELISLTEQSIAELKPTPTTQPARPKSPPKEKWSKENHPAYQAGYRKPAIEPPPEEPAPATFSVNDNVLARWTSGDNSFYPARITSITGSSANPIYIVSFKSYSTIETLTAKDIKPISSTTDSRKRKADALSGTSPTPSSTSTATPSAASTPLPANNSVISAAADINRALAEQARNEPGKPGDSRPAKMPRKVKAKKDLEAGKAKWQDFTAKGKFGKTAKKESMFRTPEGVNARVGFTGSGQQMRKDATRSRHIYQQEEDYY